VFSPATHRVHVRRKRVRELRFRGLADGIVRRLERIKEDFE
jgi:hypothetical protein